MSAKAPCSLREPGPAEDFEVREFEHADVSEWYHVYCTRSHPSTGSGTFSEGWGDTRFAPMGARRAEVLALVRSLKLHEV